MPHTKSPIIDIVNELELVSGVHPCKKSLQKIVYLIEETGEQLGYSYTIHFYGPYSADLDYDIQKESLHGNLIIDYTDYGHLLSAPKDKAASRLSTRAMNVIRNFGQKSPSELELLATTLFVQRKVSSSAPEEILPTVKKIKGAKYSDPQINNAVQALHEYKYF